MCSIEQDNTLKQYQTVENLYYNNPHHIWNTEIIIYDSLDANTQHKKQILPSSLSSSDRVVGKLYETKLSGYAEYEMMWIVL